MKKTTKKILSLLVLVSMLLGSSMSVFAAPESPVDVEDSQIEVDMDSFDITQPYEISKQYTDEDGNVVTIGAIYEPKPSIQPLIKWNKTYKASVGTWTSYYDGSIVASMRYTFDVSRSGSHWKISNGRNLSANALLSTIEGKRLSINRSISTATYPAEIYGECTIKVLDTPIGSAATLDAWIKTTISDSGTLTVCGN